jgi:hypothetical protein
MVAHPPPSADAAVSHQSALELHDLSDIITDQIHVLPGHGLVASEPQVQSVA